MIYIKHKKKSNFGESIIWFRIKFENQIESVENRVSSASEKPCFHLMCRQETGFYVFGK